MNQQNTYTDEQRRQLDFLCQQAQGLEETLRSLPREEKAYAQQMHVYLSTVKEIRILRCTVNNAEFTDELLQFAPAGDAL